MSRPGPARPPPPDLNKLQESSKISSKSVFDNRDQLNERGEKLGNLVRLTEPPDPTKHHPEPPDELLYDSSSDSL